MSQFKKVVLPLFLSLCNSTEFVYQELNDSDWKAVLDFWRRMIAEIAAVTKTGTTTWYEIEIIHNVMKSNQTE